MQFIYDIRGGKAGGIQYGSANLHENKKKDGSWWLNRLYVKPEYRGQRHGHNLMVLVCSAADEEAVELVLVVDPFGSSPMNARALRAFYRRFGFKSSRSNVNYMRRKPVSKCR